MTALITEARIKLINDRANTGLDILQCRYDGTVPLDQCYLSGGLEFHVHHVKASGRVRCWAYLCADS